MGAVVSRNRIILITAGVMLALFMAAVESTVVAETYFGRHAEQLLSRLLGVEGAVVVNNNAAAVLLACALVAASGGAMVLMPGMNLARVSGRAP